MRTTNRKRGCAELWRAAHRSLAAEGGCGHGLEMRGGTSGPFPKTAEFATWTRRSGVAKGEARTLITAAKSLQFQNSSSENLEKFFFSFLFSENDESEYEG